jgi:hypothetical protein
MARSVLLSISSTFYEEDGLMRSKQIKFVLVLACIALVVALLYVGGAGLVQMLRAHMGG